MEFLAEKELVTIIPNFSENKMCLISVSAALKQSEDFPAGFNMQPFVNL